MILFVKGRPLGGERVKRESTKHGPPPWTGAMDRVHQNMDRVHGPPIMDRVHGSPIFTSAKNSRNQRLGVRSVLSVAEIIIFANI